MANTPGTLQKRPMAIATIRKNQTAVMTQSPYIIPFYRYFNAGGPTTIAPLKGWLTRN
jgi:hypothetical protein